MRLSHLTPPVGRIMARLLCIALSAAVVTLPGVAYPRAQAAAPPAFPPAVQFQFQQALDQTVANPNVPGAIVGIWVPGRGIWIRAAGLADRATRRPMQIQDYTRIGSITKTFIGTLILQLVGDGKLPVGANACRTHCLSSE